MALRRMPLRSKKLETARQNAKFMMHRIKRDESPINLSMMLTPFGPGE